MPGLPCTVERFIACDVWLMVVTVMMMMMMVMMTMMMMVMMMTMVNRERADNYVRA